MALKLGKCRLCLKLGDFYSIYTMDNAIQLSEMAMDCARIKIYEGDGLPDKICSECVQKLSSAYIFKQQCERSDMELRRNYVPPPGFSITPPPQNRQSSDSAFSSANTDMSYNKPVSTENVTPANRSRKRSRESIDESVSSQSHDYRPSSSKRVEELRNTNKKPRNQSPNASLIDSDYEDTSFSQYSAGTDSDEPLIPHKCKTCGKEFKTAFSLRSHLVWHAREKKQSMVENAVVDIPRKSLEDAKDSDEKLTCSKCQKTFKLKIMLKRHQEFCGKNPQVDKELLISLEPIDAVLESNKPVDPVSNTPVDPEKNIECDMCPSRYKTYEGYERHMRGAHAAFPRKPKPVKQTRPEKINFPCLYCCDVFDDYTAMSTHFNDCPKRDDTLPLKCPVCHRILTKRHTYLAHVRQIHFFVVTKQETPTKTFDCRMCDKKFESQGLLISHLATHVSNMAEPEEVVDDDSGSVVEDAQSTHSDPAASSSFSNGLYNCGLCDKSFKYKKACETHQDKHAQGLIEVKVEPPDKANTSHQGIVYRDTDDEDSPAEGDDLTCDICEKQFSYKRLLDHHKRTKHNMSSGHKRAKITLKDCPVRCLICDVEMKVSAINEHNQKHITANIRPRNQYSCAECGEQFKACSSLATHIKLVHRLKQPPPVPNEQFEGTDLADFCEVVVTKTEPLDALQSHNGFAEVPVTDGPIIDMAGFTCHICSKKLKTLISLKRHVNWHANVGNNITKNIECFVCKEKFKFQCHYRLHMRAHYTDPALDPVHLTCPICARRSKHLRAAQAHLKFHNQTRFKNKDYQCSICKRVFQFRKVYLSHMAIHYKRGEGQNAIVGDRPAYNAPPAADGQPQCPQCGKICDSENSLKCHVRWHSSKTALFGARHECQICGLQFTNKRRLEIHTRDHYEDENGPFKCTICGKGYIDEEYFRRHVKGHNFDHQSHQKRLEKLRKDKVKCPICSRYYPNLVKLIRHLKRTHPESKMIKEDPDAPPPKYYSCKRCTRVFLTEFKLKKHEESHLRKHEFFKCKFCGIKSVSLQRHRLHVKQRHLTSKYCDDPLKCPYCEDTFIRGYELHHHVKDVHGIDEAWLADREEEPMGPLKELQCSICLKVLASKGNYERHLDYHNSLRCNYCFDYFSSLKFLEGHLAFSCEKKQLIGETETYPKKVKCHICYKAFAVQVKVDCHLRTQHGIKVNREASEEKGEILCDYCFKVFENIHALNMHKIYHRTIGYYGCLYCDRKFNTLQLFNRHKKQHLYKLNPDDPTKCEHCDETFVAFRDMIEHMKEVHDDDKDWVIMPKEVTEETCHICKKTFFNLHRHLAYHEENRCKKCGEYFLSRIDCDNHLCSIESDDEVQEENENDIRPKYEECTFCFKPLTKKVPKLRHDLLHNVSGAISCRFCTAKFKTLEAFNIHAFSHRSRKYHQKPIKCRICKEKFFRYGPFVKHMKTVHKSKKKMHYRAAVKPDRCVVCGGMFPNLHNHYRSHLQNQCLQCQKYFTSVKLFNDHQCDKEDADPSKVFTSDEDLYALIKSYMPKDEKDDEKFYGYTDNEDEEEDEVNQSVPETQNDDSQNSMENMIQTPFVISDVLSLYERKEELLATYQKEDPKKKELNPKKKTSPKKRTPKKKSPQKEDSQKNGSSNKNEDDDDSDVEVIIMLDDDSNGADNSNNIITIDLDDDDD